MAPAIEHQAARQRFVLKAEGEEAELTYRRSGQTLILDHTGVPPALQHRGMANLLAEAALAYARSEGLQVDPECRFMAVYFHRHKDQQDLLARR